jgi:hypothetical protein
VTASCALSASVSKNEKGAQSLSPILWAREQPELIGELSTVAGAVAFASQNSSSIDIMNSWNRRQTYHLGTLGYGTSLMHAPPPT